MGKNNAKIVNKGENYILLITVKRESVEISLTEDKLDDVRDAFNKLIVLLKSSPIELEFEKEGDDLYQQIGEEYIKQLNKELAIIRKDLEDQSMVLDEKK